MEGPASIIQVSWHGWPLLLRVLPLLQMYCGRLHLGGCLHMPLLLCLPRLLGSGLPLLLNRWMALLLLLLLLLLLQSLLWSWPLLLLLL